MAHVLVEGDPNCLVVFKLDAISGIQGSGTVSTDALTSFRSRTALTHVMFLQLAEDEEAERRSGTQPDKDYGPVMLHEHSERFH